MAANKFATMLHRNTNYITFNLVYAFLEWILILLLLFNSLFSYLVIKFSDYFGLIRPCILCSRLDQIFEPANFSYRSLVCETHALEISKLGFCSNHRKLAESHHMCEDCSSSSKSELSAKFAFFPWMKQLGVHQKVRENDKKNFNCSCCGIGLDSKLFFPDYFLIKPSWIDLDDHQKENLVLEPCVDGKVGCDDLFIENRSGSETDHCEEVHELDGNDVNLFHYSEVDTEDISVSSFLAKEVVVDHGDKVHTETQKEPEMVEKHELNVLMQEMVSQTGCAKEISGEIQTRHLEFYIDGDDCHLIPIDSIQPTVAEKEERNGEEEDLTMEKLKSELNSLYEELEEERSASAIAANQTMAMINRLQEEKAAMKMEALQYQRMMEEQAEYDQEVLQILNELMVKREKELEIYRRKVHDYETTERKIAMWNKRKEISTNGTTSPSCSNAEDSDGISVDSNQETNSVNTPPDAVRVFEDERLRILEQLRALEEKLSMLSDEEHTHFEHLSESNGIGNGHYKAKTLLPLFDAAETEPEYEANWRKMAMEEEVEEVYERLEALEADTEFLKHSITSLRKGEKGVELLQQILHHLRHLRSVENSIGDCSA